jgi:hypothetical protein
MVFGTDPDLVLECLAPVGSCSNSSPSEDSSPSEVWRGDHSEQARGDGMYGMICIS